MADAGARRISFSPPSPRSSPRASPLSNVQTPPAVDVLPPLDENSPAAVRPKELPGARRGSVQFVPSFGQAVPVVQRAQTSSPKPQRRISSPPPPPKFQSRVAFDTFDNKDASTFSFTLSARHREYAYSRRSRTFMCGMDQNDYSEYALEWLIEELADDGDEIVCLRVVDKDAKVSSDASIQEGVYKREAHRLLEHIIKKNIDERHISIILEFAVGKVHETIRRMVRKTFGQMILTDG
jgi:hypothetical protein